MELPQGETGLGPVVGLIWCYCQTKTLSASARSVTLRLSHTGLRTGLRAGDSEPGNPKEGSFEKLEKPSLPFTFGVSPGLSLRLVRPMKAAI